MKKKNQDSCDKDLKKDSRSDPGKSRLRYEERCQEEQKKGRSQERAEKKGELALRIHQGVYSFALV